MVIGFYRFMLWVVYRWYLIASMMDCHMYWSLFVILLLVCKELCLMYEDVYDLARAIVDPVQRRVYINELHNNMEQIKRIWNED